MTFSINDVQVAQDKPFIIAEIGHNHQGDLDKAKKMIKVAADCGVSAVKFQKRNNRELYTTDFYDKPYDNPNSYGPTYGLHRDKLEFTLSQFRELKELADSLNIIFFATPFDFSSLEFLEELDIPCYKIASGDLLNIPLQDKIASTGKPLFLSTGGGTLSDVKRAVDTITKHHSQLSIMHCTASYPADISDMNLNAITKLRQEFPDFIIGLSDHESGIDAASIAFMLGARSFEKHFTLNHSWKGTDQSFSLEPAGLKKLVRNISRIPVMLGTEEKKMLESERDPLFKMRKKLVASKDLSQGHTLEVDDIVIKSPGDGLPPYYLNEIVGKELKRELKGEENIQLQDLV